MIERILRHDRALVVAALAAVTALGWAYLFAGAGMTMHEMDGMSMPMRMEPWSLRYGLVVFVMWVVMMAGMMLPSAAPAVLLYAGVIRKSPGADRVQAHVYAFAGGYLLIWTAFSLAATVLQRHYGWKIGVPSMVLAAYVATSRVHDNRHYVSDVIFGSAMGIAAQRTVTLHAGRYAIHVAPSGGSGSVGVTVGVQTEQD